MTRLWSTKTGTYPSTTPALLVSWDSWIGWILPLCLKTNYSWNSDKMLSHDLARTDFGYNLGQTKKGTGGKQLLQRYKQGHLDLFRYTQIFCFAQINIIPRTTPWAKANFNKQISHNFKRWKKFCLSKKSTDKHCFSFWKLFQKMFYYLAEKSKKCWISVVSFKESD